MPFNIINSINEITQTLGGAGTGVNKVNALDELNTVLTTYLSVNGPQQGTYLPVATALVNLTSVTPAPATYSRIASIVTVSGVIAAVPTAAGAWSFEIDLPFPSALAVASDLAGAFNLLEIDSVPRFLAAIPANDTAGFGAIAVVTFTTTSLTYMFQYIVL